MTSVMVAPGKENDGINGIVANKQNETRISSKRGSQPMTMYVVKWHGVSCGVTA